MYMHSFVVRYGLPVCCDRRSVASCHALLAPRPTTLHRSCSPLNKRMSEPFLHCMPPCFASASAMRCVCVCACACMRACECVCVWIYTLLCRFVKGLTLLHKDFRQAVLSANRAHEKPVLSEDTLRLILGNVGSLLNLNSGLLEELQLRMSNW